MTTQLIYAVDEATGKLVPKLKEPRELYTMTIRDLGLLDIPRWPLGMEAVTAKTVPLVCDLNQIDYWEPSLPNGAANSDVPPTWPTTNSSKPKTKLIYSYKASVHSLLPKPAMCTIHDAVLSTDPNACALWSRDTKQRHTLHFESRFESGNLEQVFQTGPHSYELWMRCDLLTDRTARRSVQQWFYFRVSNTRRDITFHFTICNFVKPQSLYNTNGMCPLMYSEKSGRGWAHIGHNVSYSRYSSATTQQYLPNTTSNSSNHVTGGCSSGSNGPATGSGNGSNSGPTTNGESTGTGDGNKFYALSFSFQFPHDGDTCYFAYCYPYTFSDLQKHILKLHRTYSRPTNRRAPLLKVRPLCRSVSGNPVYVLTITSPPPPRCISTTDSESERGNSAAENELNTAQTGDTSTTTNKADAGQGIYTSIPSAARQSGRQQQRKPAVVVSARVHPGESNSSYMMRGLIDFLLGDSDEAVELRERFVFKLVPMLNPDGVICGNYRCNLSGHDLNRCYKNPSKELHPSVYALKELIRRLQQENSSVVLFCDMHGHSRKSHSFVYGCGGPGLLGTCPELVQYHVRASHHLLLPYLLSRRCGSLFKWDSCNFNIQRHKEGTGRVVIWATGILNSFTFESSFAGNDEAHFTMSDLEKLGASLALALYDYTKFNHEQVMRSLILTHQSARDRHGRQISANSAESENENGRESTATKPADLPLRRAVAIIRADGEHISDFDFDTEDDDDLTDNSGEKEATNSTTSNRRQLRISSAQQRHGLTAAPQRLAVARTNNLTPTGTPPLPQRKSNPNGAVMPARATNMNVGPSLTITNTRNLKPTKAAHQQLDGKSRPTSKQDQLFQTKASENSIPDATTECTSETAESFSDPKGIAEHVENDTNQTDFEQQSSAYSFNIGSRPVPLFSPQLLENDPTEPEELFESSKSTTSTLPLAASSSETSLTGAVSLLVDSQNQLEKRTSNDNDQTEKTELPISPSSLPRMFEQLVENGPHQDSAEEQTKQPIAEHHRHFDYSQSLIDIRHPSDDDSDTHLTASTGSGRGENNSADGQRRQRSASSRRNKQRPLSHSTSQSTLIKPTRLQRRERINSTSLLERRLRDNRILNARNASATAYIESTELSLFSIGSSVPSAEKPMPLTNLPVPAQLAILDDTFGVYRRAPGGSKLSHSLPRSGRQQRLPPATATTSTRTDRLQVQMFGAQGPYAVKQSVFPLNQLNKIVMVRKRPTLMRNPNNKTASITRRL